MRPRRLDAVIAFAGVVAVVLVAGTPAPAEAHTVAGVQPTNYRSEILAVTPAVAGLRLRLLDLGRRIELVNHTSTEVVVLGYQGEPYLRVGPAGVFENRRSPSLYQNRPLPFGASATTLPPQADAAATPTWHKISSGHVARWRDRRTRWEGKASEIVRGTHGRTRVVVTSWTIELRHGGRPVLVDGRITWMPPGSPLPWLAVALALLVAAVVMARAQRWGRLLAGCVAVLVATDLVRTIGQTTASHDALGVEVARALLGGIFSLAAWLVGAASIGWLQREDDGGLIGAAAAGLVIAIFGGLTDISVLSRSQLPFAFPGVIDRAAVAVSLGIGLGVAAGAVLRLREPFRLRGRAASP
ncbi:MAG: hypothetical protein E6G17_10330 [Actinobacteria bacterium]|nr:MAG: hypothetical protein E6G17_10330 [Actinomycetota bacterium]